MPLIKLFSKQRWKKCHWQSCSLNWEAEDVRRSLSTWSRIWSFLVSAALHNNQVCRLDIIEVKSLQDDRVTFRTTTIKVFELAGRLPTIQVGLKIFQICLPGWFPWLHGGEQDRVRAVQPRHFPRQHWRLPWPLAWSWSSSARTDPGATNLKAGSLENLLILTNWNALAEILVWWAIYVTWVLKAYPIPWEKRFRFSHLFICCDLDYPTKSLLGHFWPPKSPI